MPKLGYFTLYIYIYIYIYNMDLLLCLTLIIAAMCNVVYIEQQQEALHNRILVLMDIVVAGGDSVAVPVIGKQIMYV